MDRATVCRWFAGEKRPGSEHAARLHELLGIDPGAWHRLPGETAAAASQRHERAALVSALAEHLGLDAAALVAVLEAAGLVPESRP